MNFNKFCISMIQKRPSRWIQSSSNMGLGLSQPLAIGKKSIIVCNSAILNMPILSQIMESSKINTDTGSGSIRLLLNFPHTN
jgi:hypothetical protein